MSVNYYLIQAWILNIVCILGFFCNLLSVIIFLIHAPLRQRTFTMLQVTLSLFDTLLLVTAWPTLSLNPIMHNGIVKQFGHWAVLGYVSYISMNIAMTGCILTSVVVTYERYCAVCRPMQNLLVDTSRRSKILVVIVVLVCIAINVVRIYDIELTENLRHNETQFLTASSLQSNIVYSFIVRIVLEALLTYSIPIVASLVMGSLMITELWRQDSVLRKPDEQRPNCSRNSAKFLVVTQEKNGELTPVRSTSNLNVAETHCTVYMTRTPNAQATAQQDRIRTGTLVIIQMFKFVTAFTFPVVSNVIETHMLIKGHGSDPSEISQLQVVATHIISAGSYLIIIHSSTNFVLYVVFCREFRTGCIKIIRCLRQTRPEQNHLLEQVTGQQHAVSDSIALSVVGPNNTRTRNEKWKRYS